MRARWLALIGATALVAVVSLGAPLSAAPPRKCPKGKVTRTANGVRTCVGATRFRPRGTAPANTVSVLRSALTQSAPRLRPRRGKAPGPAIAPRLAAEVTAAYPKAEATLIAAVRGAVGQASTARSDELAASAATLTVNADGSATGRLGLSGSDGHGGSLEAAISLTGRPATGALDVGIDVTSQSADGTRVTKGIAMRDITRDRSVKCPAGSEDIRGTGGVDATIRSEERFGGGRVKLGTVREATTVTSSSSAHAGVGADGAPGPIQVSITQSLDYSRSAQVLAFLSSRSRAVASGTLTATVDPATGAISGASVSTKVRSSGFGSDQAAAEATFRSAIEKMLRDEAGRLRDKLVKAAKDCAGSYDVTLSLTTTGSFATHDASGTLDATLTATRDAAASAGGAATFTASGPLGYAGLAFTSKTSGCGYTSPVSVPGTWKATLTRTAAGLRVTWGSEGKGPTSTATVVCEGASIPGQPGPSLLQPTPTTFELPPEGGRQAIAGGFTSGGDGWTNTGTITVVRHPS